MRNFGSIAYSIFTGAVLANIIFGVWWYSEAELNDGLFSDSAAAWMQAILSVDTILAVIGVEEWRRERDQAQSKIKTLFLARRQATLLYKPMLDYYTNGVNFAQTMKSYKAHKDGSGGAIIDGKPVNDNYIRNMDPFPPVDLQQTDALGETPVGDVILDLAEHVRAINNWHRNVIDALDQIEKYGPVHGRKERLYFNIQSAIAYAENSLIPSAEKSKDTVMELRDSKRQIAPNITPGQQNAHS